MLLYELPGFELYHAESLDQAVGTLKKYGEKARVLSGGTDLLSLMKERIEGPRLRIPEVLVDIKNIPELKGITYHAKSGLRIGAAVTLSSLEGSETIQKKIPVLSVAAGQIGTTQIRNRGTIAGNLCQRPRCMYFRHSHFICLKKGGKTCLARIGEHRYDHSIIQMGKCAMAHPSDLAPALMALDARVEIAGFEGLREISLAEFFTSENLTGETVLRPEEFIVGFQIPSPQPTTRQHFLKLRIRRASDFALANVAVAAEVSDEICGDVRIMLGGIAPSPYMASRSMEMLKGKAFTEKLISEAAEACVIEAKPLKNNSYKVDLAMALVRRALESIAAEQLDS